MSTELDPIVGNWYRHLDKGQPFLIVAFDEEEGIVELQHYDGDVEEVELKNWNAMELELSDAPEDWSGPIDNVERDDMDYTETEMSRSDWNEPLHENAPSATEAWEDTTVEEELDATAEGKMAEESWEQDQVENDTLASVEIEKPGAAEEAEPEE